MVREIITLNIGQAGIQLGQSIWQQYCAEHGIDSDGNISKPINLTPLTPKSQNAVLNNLCDKRLDSNIGCFFDESDSGNYVARNLSVDLEPNVIDDVKTSSISSLFYSQYLLNGMEDAANNFARGRYTVGKEIINQVFNGLHKLTEQCDSLQGFIFNHSVGGGTGSGLGAFILEKMITENGFKKKSKLGFEIYPSRKYSNCVVEPYNSVFATQSIIHYEDLSFILDNEALYEIYQNKLNVKHPTYGGINHLISKAISSLTASIRFEGELNLDIEDLKTNLIPFPRLKFMTTSLSPILTPHKMETFIADARTLTDYCFNESSFFVKIPDFEATDDQYICTLLMFRGNIVSKDASAATEWVKKNEKCTFVDWCPTGFKICLNEMPLSCLPGTGYGSDSDDINNTSSTNGNDNDDEKTSDNNKINNKYHRRRKSKNYIDGVKIHGSKNGNEIGYSKNSAIMIGNNLGISRVFSNILCKKFDLMYSQRAFVHWYVGEGMEEGEFAEAREDLCELEKDYLEMMNMNDGDSDDDDTFDDDDDEL